MVEPLDKLVEKMPNWLVAIFGVLFVLFTVWVFAGSYLDSHARSKDSRYTIGFVTKTSYVVGPSSHSVSFFTYNVKGHAYSTSSDGDLEAGCARCLLKYAATDPENIDFFNHICIPDSITRAPAEGWKEPPFPVPSYAR